MRKDSLLTERALIKRLGNLNIRSEDLETECLSLAFSGDKSMKEIKGHIRTLDELGVVFGKRIHGKKHKKKYYGLHGELLALAEMAGGEKRHEEGRYQFNQGIEALPLTFLDRFPVKKVGNDAGLSMVYLSIMRRSLRKRIIKENINLGILTNWEETLPLLGVNDDEGHEVSYAVNLVKHKGSNKIIKPISDFSKDYNAFGMGHMVQATIFNRALEGYKNGYRNTVVNLCNEAISMSERRGEKIDPNLYILKGMCLGENSESYDNAIGLFDKAIDLPYGESPKAYLEKGIVHTRQKDKIYSAERCFNWVKEHGYGNTTTGKAAQIQLNRLEENKPVETAVEKRLRERRASRLRK